MFTKNANAIFERVIADYHLSDDVDVPLRNPFAEGSLDALLYHKCWIDAVQWHLEDIIRDPAIDPVAALTLKRRIDASNQVRTDMVEYIDSWFLQKYASVAVRGDARLNTETPAWAVDRLSILALKIYHMGVEADRTGLDAVKAKLDVLLEQRVDLSTAIEELLEDIAAGRKRMKVYKQMKMYNDPSLNPVLYASAK